MPASPHWPDIVFSPAWLERLDRMARRRFVEEAAAEEATTFVIERLSESDWQRCRKFRGAAKPETWLFSVAANLLEEFSRQRFGRVRPPQWLQQEGELWVSIWRWLCLERQMAESITDTLCRDGSREPDLIRNVMRAIKARLPWCGVSTLPIPVEYRDEEGREVSLLDRTHSHAAPLDALAGEQREDVLATLSALIGLEDEPALDITDNDQLVRLRRRLALEDDERLLLKLHFREGLSGLAIARLLGVPNHQPGRQIRRLLKRIREAFEAEGIPLDAPTTAPGEPA